jgi:hypothetical protein
MSFGDDAIRLQVARPRGHASPTGWRLRQTSTYPTNSCLLSPSSPWDPAQHRYGGVVKNPLSTTTLISVV